MQGVPEYEQSQTARNNGQPNDASSAPPSEPATGPGSGETSAEDTPASERGNATQQFPRPSDDENVGQHSERQDG